MRMRRDVDEGIRKLAAEQFGHVRLDQVLELGGDLQLVRRRERVGMLRRTWPNVTSIAGLPRSWTSELWAAHLQLGPASIVSHQSAAQLSDVEGVERDLVTLSLPAHTGYRFPGVRIHHIYDHEPQDVTMVAGLPVTVLPRTIVDLAAVSLKPRIRYVLQGAVGMRRCTLEEVGAVLARVRRSGKPGVRLLHELLDEMAGEPVDGTRLEQLLDSVLSSMPGAAPVPQVLLGDSSTRVGIVDRVFLAEKLVVEADGRRWHVRQQRMKEDRRRDAEAAALGFQTLRFMWEQLSAEPGWCRETLRATLEHRRQPNP